MAIGYSGLATPPDDTFDLSPLIERLEASPSWLALWREEMAHWPSGDAAQHCLEHVIRKSRRDAAADCVDYVRSYECDDAKLAQLQRVALGVAA